jgi:hypothetical protein
MDETLMQAITPLLKHVRMEPDRGRSLLEAHQYVISARPLPDIDEPFSSVPMTFVACVNDDEQLDSNLLRSPCLGPGTPHQVILQRGQSSAAQGFNDGLSRAEHDLVVFVHQDMYLPRGWDTRFTRAWSEAAEKYSPLGAAGLYGLTYRDEGKPTPIGRVVSQERALDRPTPMPAPADGFDEILLAVPRDTRYRFDERLGFHSYGADLCLSLRELGQFAVVLEAPAFHNSLRAGLDSAFHISREILLAKWPETRPLFGPTGRLDIMTADYDRSQRIAELTTRMEALRRERDSMLASNSWRLTAPLRRIRDLVRPRRRPGRP